MKNRSSIYLYAYTFFILNIAGTALMMKSALADEAVNSAVEEYMEFTGYSSSLIWPEQIPKQDWKKVFLIDARDAKQFEKENIPGSINIE